MMFERGLVQLQSSVLQQLPGLVLLALLGVLAWLGLGSAHAHEGRPVFIQLTATSPAGSSAEKDLAEQGVEIELRWKIPPVIQAGLEPAISLLAPSCILSRPHTGMTAITPPQALVGKKNYQCNQPPANPVIAIDYPQSNPALSSLVVVYDHLGNSQHIYSNPEKTRILVPGNTSMASVASQYTIGGIKHILAGPDHLLFVLCLIVVAGSTKRILVAITGFTLAHSLTLALAVLNVVTLPILFVEVLIALSIVLLAAEIIKVKRAGQASTTNYTLTWRWPVLAAIGFGLLHGFGFASVLSEFGLPQTMKITALLFFNVGVEIGQVIFIVACLLATFLLTQWLSSKRAQQLLRAGIYLVGVTASYWALQRFALALY